MDYSVKDVNQDGGYTIYTLDTQVYHVLLDAKKGGNPLLKHFKIEFPEQYPQTYINSINIGRTFTYPDRDRTTFDTNAYNVTVEIVITTKNYKTMKRREILKTACYEVVRLIENSVLDSFVKVESQVFEYDNTNVITNARIVLNGMERFNKEHEELEFKRVCRILENLEIKKHEGV